MGKRVPQAVLAHLDPNKLALLDELSAMTRTPRAVLIREAIDDLLEKHRGVWKQNSQQPPTARAIHIARLAKTAKPKQSRPHKVRRFKQTKIRTKDGGNS